MKTLPTNCAALSRVKQASDMSVGTCCRPAGLLGLPTAQPPGDLTISQEPLCQARAQSYLPAQLPFRSVPQGRRCDRGGRRAASRLCTWRLPFPACDIRGMSSVLSGRVSPLQTEMKMFALLPSPGCAEDRVRGRQKKRRQGETVSWFCCLFPI